MAGRKRAGPADPADRDGAKQESQDDVRTDRPRAESAGALHRPDSPEELARRRVAPAARRDRDQPRAATVRGVQDMVPPRSPARGRDLLQKRLQVASLSSQEGEGGGVGGGGQDREGDRGRTRIERESGQRVDQGKEGEVRHGTQAKGTR